MLSEADVRSALRDCYDPVLSCNLVDLGLIRGITVTPDPDAPGSGIPGVPDKAQVHLVLTLTSPSEEAEAQTAAQIRNRLAGLESVTRTDVHFNHQPAWSPTDITPAGRRLLGLDGNRTLIQIR